LSDKYIDGYQYIDYPAHMNGGRTNPRRCTTPAGPDGEPSPFDADLAAAFKALSDPSRVAILRQLGEEGEVCACDLKACCTLAQPTVSHHLKVLRKAGLVSYERHGQWLYYRPESAAIQELMSRATECFGINGGTG